MLKVWRPQKDRQWFDRDALLHIAEQRVDPGDRPKPDAAGDPRIPVRDPGVRGPVGVYYYDHLVEVLGPDASTETALTRRTLGEVLAFEALNLVDGRRSVSEIRDLLAGLYEPVPVVEVAEYLELLARAKVISWSGAAGSASAR